MELLTKRLAEEQAKSDALQKGAEVTAASVTAIGTLRQTSDGGVQTDAADLPSAPLSREDGDDPEEGEEEGFGAVAKGLWLEQESLLRGQLQLLQVDGWVVEWVGHALQGGGMEDGQVCLQASSWAMV